MTLQRVGAAYSALALPPGAPADDVKRAYRALALRTHPDRNPGDSLAPARFARVREAYETITQGVGGAGEALTLAVAVERYRSVVAPPPAPLLDVRV